VNFQRWPGIAKHKCMPMQKETINIPNAADAKAVGLRYVSDSARGFNRKKSGKSFKYFDSEGNKITDENILLRIKKLVIPPAWKNVWICPQENGHLQATGRDARGRKQYRYHQNWRKVRDENKYGKLILFAENLPLIRKKTDEDLKLPGLPREKVIALVVRLLELTCIRIGNEEYAKQNQSFGLTTMRDQHVEISGSKVKFEFKGKSGKMHSIGLEDKQLARLVKKCKEIPGYELFQFIDEANIKQSVGSADVNDYLRNVSGQDFTAKDFRTWAGTVMAATVLCNYTDCNSVSRINKNIRAAITEVAEKLGNTVAICRKCYIHPVILEMYTDGKLIKQLSKKPARKSRNPYALTIEESAVLEVLKRIEREIKKAA
jgi:DNA topoisomerase I